MSQPPPKREKPRYVRILDGIASSGLPPGQRDVLRAALRSVNRDGLLWPAIENLAKDLGRALSVVRGHVRALERAGIWEVVERSRGGINRATGRGIPNRWRWRFDRMNPPDSVGLSGDKSPQENPPDSGEESADSRPGTHRKTADNPPAFGGELSREPSMHEPSKREPSSGGATEPKARAPAGMDGWGDVRSALRRCGVRGPNVETLAAVATLTVDEVRSEWVSLQEGQSARSQVAVLVHRLAERHGIRLTSKPPIPAGILPLQRRLEAARRAKGFGGGGSGGGGSDAAPLSDLIGGGPPTAPRAV